jgi:beta-glucosidase
VLCFKIYSPRRQCFRAISNGARRHPPIKIEGSVSADGRTESIWDRFCQLKGKIADGSSGAGACDHYRRFREDIRLMRELGIRTYRFSVAWPRILPIGAGSPNQPGLRFYDELVDELLRAGIEPLVTLYHWDLPQNLQDQGGWPARQTAHAFGDYADVVARRLGDRVRHWVTVNEPWCVSFLSHLIGRHAPGLQDWNAALTSTCGSPRRCVE